MFTWQRPRLWSWLFLVASLAACGPAGTPAGSVGPAEAEAPGTAPIESGATASPESGTTERADRGPLIVALGDSLTAGLGLEVEEAYPALLEQRLRDEGIAVTVVNAGVSGDTSAAGLRRAAWSLDGDVRVLIVALGGNDGLRGLPVDQMKQNLEEIVSLASARGIAVLLAGMEAPPNFGGRYTDEFRDVFRQLADEQDVVFMPFLLDGVAGNPALNQADGIHPTAEGAAVVAERVRAALEPLLVGLR